MPLAARLLLDLTSHPGFIVPGPAGPSNVLIGGMPAARASDTHISIMPPLAGPHPPSPMPMPKPKGSESVLINNLQALRQNDKSGCGATILTGVAGVEIGD